MAEHKEAVKYFVDKHMEVLGRKYYFFGGKDGKIVKVMTEAMGIETFKTLVDLYFEQKDLSYWKDDEKINVIHSIQNLFAKTNWLRARPHFNEIEKRHIPKPDSAIEQIAKLPEIPRGMTRKDHQDAVIRAGQKAKELTA